MIGKKGGHLLGNATPLASMAGPVLRQQLSHGAAIGHSRVGWVGKKLVMVQVEGVKTPSGRNKLWLHLGELVLASLVQLIDGIGVVTAPGALSIDVFGVGQGRGR